MSNQTYQKLLNNFNRIGHCLCVGIDPDLSKLPTKYPQTLNGLDQFLEELIKDTAQNVIAYKPNISFFEALGIEGLKLLEKVRKYIPSSVPLVLDAKRGDIGNTAKMQARYLFDYFGADASTLHPYMGIDSLEPFFQYKQQLHFVLGLTSNPSSNDFEKLLLNTQIPLYEHIIKQCIEWNKTFANIGIVAGATHKELSKIRKLDDKLLLLIPGVGAQGGSYSDAFKEGSNKDKIVLINSSRAILYNNPEMSFIEKINLAISE